MKNLLFLLVTLASLTFIACDSKGTHDHDHDHDAIDMTALRAELQSMEDAYAKSQIAKDADGR